MATTHLEFAENERVLGEVFVELADNLDSHLHPDRRDRRDRHRHPPLWMLESGYVK